MKNIIHKIKANSFSLLVLLGTPFLIIYSNYQLLFSTSKKLTVSYITIQCLHTTVGIFLTLLIFKYFKNENIVKWLFLLYGVLFGFTCILLTLADFKISGTITHEDLTLLPLMFFMVAYPSSELISRFINKYNLNKSSEN
ncbi:MAG: hypothetical protein IPG89_08250 [Bacteroidetes bacterium]|nr:hypothetical protein [Bacteroidota bacterium]